MRSGKQSIKNNWLFAGYMLLAIYFLLPALMNAQEEKKFIREGNKLYENKKYAEAEKSYQQSLKKNNNSYKGNFNLGDAYYQQGKYEEAAQQFQLLTHKGTSKDTLSKAYHNLGNALLKTRKYEESINAYKNALKNNPNDEDSRYNLAYAQRMLRQQQQQQNKDNKDNKDQKNDKDKKDDQDKKNKQNKEQEQKDKQEQQKNQISKEDAQRMLDALQNDEKNIQDKVKKGKVKGVKVEIEKDW